MGKTGLSIFPSMPCVSGKQLFREIVHIPLAKQKNYS